MALPCVEEPAHLAMQGDRECYYAVILRIHKKLRLCITMGKFKKYEIGHDHPVVIDLSNYLPTHHLCKQVEMIVSELDTSEIERKYSDVGQNALHPKMMLNIIFYGYIVGIRTGRKLAQACEEQLPFIYLSKSHRPKKSALNDFRKNHYKHFEEFFLQVLKKCQASGLGDTSLSIVDGSKKEANSSKRRTKTKEQYEKWRQTLLEDIASLEQGLTSDNKEIKKN